MKETRFWFGLSVTALWLGYLVYMLSTHSRPAELDQWGDIFAGFFAPLAFLWLVIGYLQQGEELRHSTEALLLQAHELRNSVEMQSQLVAVSREQMKQEFNALQEERELRRDASRPKFVPNANGSNTSGAIVTYMLRIANVGNTATHFAMTFEPSVVSLSSLNYPVISRDGALELQLRIALNAPIMASIRYIDADGLPGEVQFSIQAPGNGSLLLGNIERLV